ncbi:regulator of G-protein signaling 8 [Engraulis encrasicolus]|uniref:regulator of G-protein signaling 8 n=1 Tax=Engraulis encrasicolus TaxID=184585 RepID=UPI002FD6A01B
MPKLLFSKIRIYEFNSLLSSGKKTSKFHLLLSRKRQKDNIRCILVRKVADRTSLCADYDYRSIRGQNAERDSLAEFLKNKYYMAAFREFLRSEFSEENLEFWLACREYRESTSSARRFLRATEIYQEFLHPTAEKEVNLNQRTRDRVKGQMASASALPRCFEEAESEVLRLMETDSWHRFLKSTSSS